MKPLEIKEIQRILKEAIGAKRYIHSLGVMDTAIKLASKYNYNTDKAALAGLIHDCGKLKDDKEILKMAKKTGIIQDNVMTNNPALIHGPLGAIIAKEIYGINDRDVLDAVRYHTTGRVRMSLLDKIVYLSDYIEPYRSFHGVKEVRELAYLDLDKALLMSMENTIVHIINKGLLLHHDTVSARNDLIVNLTRNGR